MTRTSSSPRPLPTAPRGSAINTWLIVLLLGLVGVLVYRQVFRLSPLFSPGAESRTVTPRGDFAEDEKTTIELFEKVSPSVVHITTEAIHRNIFTSDIRRTPAGTGSGFVWDNAGHIVTNLHVIEDAQAATVTLADNTSYPARLVGFDPLTDLAVLKIEADAARLLPIQIGSSDDLRVGQKVFAIGSPYEFDHTLTTGIISGLNRKIGTDRTQLYGAIQTDAAINPGNSGGPLLDSAGRLIGVNTAIVSESGGSHGIGFAVPVDLVNVAVPDLVRDGEISRPWMGVALRNNPRVYNSDGQVVALPGVMVVQVAPGGPADQAGLVSLEWRSDGQFQADLIVAIAGQKVNSLGELVHVLSQHRPGDQVTFTVLRGQLEHDFQMTLTEMPQTSSK
ncbi:MAG: trypsin-like peptidase domain-containing protein [Planctomycetota bacterium]|nr:trypsin-like peptidase domain-containing protein [Planctomycetota bacterium]MDA1249503.1 trypsin-like peptidase domain-containing protein [Planctomycetota bacterium]